MNKNSVKYMQNVSFSLLSFAKNSEKSLGSDTPEQGCNLTNPKNPEKKKKQKAPLISKFT